MSRKSLFPTLIVNDDTGTCDARCIISGHFETWDIYLSDTANIEYHRTFVTSVAITLSHQQNWP